MGFSARFNDLCACKLEQFNYSLNQRNVSTQIELTSKIGFKTLSDWRPIGFSES